MKRDLEIYQTNIKYGPFLDPDLNNSTVLKMRDRGGAVGAGGRVLTYVGRGGEQKELRL